MQQLNLMPAVLCSITASHQSLLYNCPLTLPSCERGLSAELTWTADMKTASLWLLREVTHWTQSGPADDHVQRASTVQIVVEEIIKDAAGAVVLKTKAELPQVGERDYAFVFKVSLLFSKLTSVTQLLPCKAGLATGAVREIPVSVLAISKACFLSSWVVTRSSDLMHAMVCCSYQSSAEACLL